VPFDLRAALSASSFLIAWAIAAAAAIGVFLHANRHGSRHATAWGAGVFLILIVFLPLYIAHYRMTRKRQRRY
jgi:membrane protein YdbS with pleckstrin-like domain